MRFTLIVLLASTLFACQSKKENTEESNKFRIVTTTGMIGDAAQAIGGEHVEVTSLMGPGVDPHLYKASQGDLKSLSRADVIIYNGLHLEGKMGEILEKLERQKPVVPMSLTLDSSKLISLSESLKDPHIWFDVPLWISGLEGIKNAMVRHDPKHAEIYEKNYGSYITQLRNLDAWVREQIAAIPMEKRIMITSHDAFNYFGNAYDVQVKGLQGISTLAEYGLRDITNMVDFIVSSDVRYVFIESSVSKKSLEAVMEGCRARGHELNIGGELFSDAMGQKGTKEGTYIGMIEHNVSILVNAFNQ